MKKNFVLISIVFVSLLSRPGAFFAEGEKVQNIKELDLTGITQEIHSRGTVKSSFNFGEFPIYFIFNRGQVNEKAKFYAKTSRYTLWITKEGLVFDSSKYFAETEKNKELPHSHRRRGQARKRQGKLIEIFSWNC